MSYGHSLFTIHYGTERNEGDAKQQNLLCISRFATMKKIDILRALSEFACTALLLYLFPFALERKLKLLFLYIFCQFLVGRFQNKSLLVWDEIRRILIGYCGFLFCALMLISYKSSTWQTQVGMTLLFTVCDFLITLLLTRFIHLWFYKPCKEKTMIVGVGHTANNLAEVMRCNRFSLLENEAFVNCNGHPKLSSFEQEQIVPENKTISWKQMDQFIEDNDITTALIAIPELIDKELSHLSSHLSKRVKTVKYMPFTDQMVNFASNIEDFDGMLMISTSHGKITWIEKVFKRMIDIVGGLVGCIILLPLTGYVYFYNRKNGDTDPIFFTQERIGKNGKLFKCHKFRTMVPNAEQILEELMEKDPAIREEYMTNKKLQDDPRITKAGKFLRKTSLDEFPQFIDVLKGDMSVIGPRPYLPREAEDMEDKYETIVSVAPGVTGMWQTHGRSNVSFERRLEMDEYYCNNWNLWLDLTILVKTIKSMLFREEEEGSAV